MKAPSDLRAEPSETILAGQTQPPTATLIRLYAKQIRIEKAH